MNEGAFHKIVNSVCRLVLQTLVFEKKTVLFWLRI